MLFSIHRENKRHKYLFVRQKSVGNVVVFQFFSIDQFVRTFNIVENKENETHA